MKLTVAGWGVIVSAIALGAPLVTVFLQWRAQSGRNRTYAKLKDLIEMRSKASGGEMGAVVSILDTQIILAASELKPDISRLLEAVWHLELVDSSTPEGTAAAARRDARVDYVKERVRIERQRWLPLKIAGWIFVVVGVAVGITLLAVQGSSASVVVGAVVLTVAVGVLASFVVTWIGAKQEARQIQAIGYFVSLQDYADPLGSSAATSSG